VDLLPDLRDISPALAVVILCTVAMFVVAISFLVAASRLRRANSRKAELWAALEVQFGQQVQRIAYGEAPVAALHARIGRGEQVVLLDYLYKAMVQEARPARRELYAELARPYLGQLEERARTGDTWQRARAVRTLAELAGANAAATIFAALDDPAPHVAMTAARVYAQQGLGPVDPLLERIERYGSWDRRLLRSVLVSFGRPAAPALHALMADASSPAPVRAVCADALASLDSRGVGETAAAILRGTEDVDLVAACLRLLRPPATEAQREVVRRLCRAEDDVVRGQAVACLARIGRPEDMELLNLATADLSPWVVRSATLGLAYRGVAVPGAG
jgi:HEAT repeat protein